MAEYGIVAPTSLAACPSNPCQRRAVHTWLDGAIAPRCPPRPLSGGVRPSVTRMSAFSHTRGFTLSSRHGGQVAWKAVPDPKLTFPNQESSSRCRSVGASVAGWKRGATGGVAG
jgi:hypothetical protein